jgi:hypothetical protein
MIVPPKYKGAGIYGIYNGTKDKWYIGSSVSVNQRIYGHIGYLKRGKAVQKLQTDYDNGDDFTVFVLAEVSEYKTYGELLNIERAYIEKYNSIKDGYNTEIPVCAEDQINSLKTSISLTGKWLESARNDWQRNKILERAENYKNFIEEQKVFYLTPICDLAKRKNMYSR